MTFYKVKDEYLPLWGDEISFNWLTYEDLKDICRVGGCEVEDIFYQLEVFHNVVC